MKPKLALLALIAIIIFSCSKNNGSDNPTVSSLNIINLTVGSQSIVPNFGVSGFIYANSVTVPYGTTYLFSPSTGKHNLILAEITDTASPFLNGSFTWNTGGIYSLFTAGTDSTKTDTLFVQDQVPNLNPADSSTGVRFVNMATGSNPVNVDIVGGTGFVASNLAYKAITGFQTFSANTAASTLGYTFEFRDAESGTLLASFPLTIALNKSQTLAFYGSALAGYAVMNENNY